MNIVTVNGTRLLITGGADGAALAMKPQTGEPVWNLVIAKRGLNTGIVVNGKYAIVSHSEENLEGNEMGMLAAFDATGKGKLGKDSIKWAIKGFMGGFSSPVIDGDRIYQADNGGNLFAFDVETGRQLWKQNMGTMQKASAVFADGKIYVGTRERQVLYPAAARRPLRSAERGRAADQRSGPGVAKDSRADRGRRGRGARPRLLRFERHALRHRSRRRPRRSRGSRSTQTMEPGQGAPAWVQVAPTEMVLKPGETVQLHARLFDAQGRFLREEKRPTWSLDGLEGHGDRRQVHGRAGQDRDRPD